MLRCNPTGEGDRGYAHLTPITAVRVRSPFRTVVAEPNSPSVEDKPMRRTFIQVLTAFSPILLGDAVSWAQPVCKPTLVFSEARYAPMKLPRLERTWTVAFAVDASRCATDSGSFSIVFTLWKENAPDIEFVETFQWVPDLNVISKEFWADEAVGAYLVSEVRPCPCADRK
jgi:hypothetical protein